MSNELLARFLLNADLKPGVTCSSSDRKEQPISTGKLLALVFLEDDLDQQSGKFPSSINELLAPLEVGMETANWTTERLAEYLGQQTGIHVVEETVRVYLHAHDYVCKRSTWTLRRKAEEKADYVGNA